MHYLLLSDLHLTCNTPVARLDNIEETWKSKLTYIFKYAISNRTPILVAGDFFDKPRDWKTLSEFIKLLTSFEPMPKIYSVFGQHDMYLYSKNREQTSLGILINSGLVQELSSRPVQYSSTNVYGASWGQEIPKPDGMINILVIHRNISDAPLFPGHEYTNAEMFLKAHPEYHVIICGDIHKRFLYKNTLGRMILNPGPLMRLEATEYNMTSVPKFAVFNSKDYFLNWVSIPHEPSQIVLSRTHIENKKETTNMLDDFIKSVSVDHQITFSFKENLQEYLTTNSISQKIKDKIAEVMNETGTN